MVQPYNSTDMDTFWKNSYLVLFWESDFHMAVNLSTTVHALSMQMLTSLSVDASIYIYIYMQSASRKSLMKTIQGCCLPF